MAAKVVQIFIFYFLTFLWFFQFENSVSLRNKQRSIRNAMQIEITYGEKRLKIYKEAQLSSWTIFNPTNPTKSNWPRYVTTKNDDHHFNVIFTRFEEDWMISLTSNQIEFWFFRIASMNEKRFNKRRPKNDNKSSRKPNYTKQQNW